MKVSLGIKLFNGTVTWIKKCEIRIKSQIVKYLLKTNHDLLVFNLLGKIKLIQIYLFLISNQEMVS